MAGRPVKAAEKIVALDSRMSEVVRLFFDYLPGMYSTKRPDEPIGQDWYYAMMALIEASERIEALGEALCDKAGVTWGETKARIAEIQGESAKAEPVTAGG